VVDGIKQNPMEGVSMVYTFDKENADAPSTHKTQYFEMIGDRAIYHDGWILSTKVMRVPWDNSGTADNDPGIMAVGTVRPQQGLDTVQRCVGSVS
jgi:arylsulfatase A-like enzyme